MFVILMSCKDDARWPCLKIIMLYDLADTHTDNISKDAGALAIIQSQVLNKGDQPATANPIIALKDKS